MQIDKKIDSIYSVVSRLTVNKSIHIGESGYFVNDINELANLSYCIHGVLCRIDDSKEDCFQAINYYNDELCESRYFLPDSHISEMSNEYRSDEDYVNLKTILESAGIVRFHTCSRMRKQALSDHMWKVAMLSHYLLPVISKEGLLYALTHDCNEIITGDIPATCKWKYPEIKKSLSGIEESFQPFRCSHDEMIVVKIADFLEGMLFCALSYNDGCREALVIYRRWESKFVPFLDNNRLSDEVIRRIRLVLRYIKEVLDGNDHE